MPILYQIREWHDKLLKTRSEKVYFTAALRSAVRVLIFIIPCFNP